MKRLFLLSAAVLVFGGTAALAGSTTATLREAKTHATLPQVYIQETPADAKASFGSALEDAMMRPTGGNLSDPSGRFAIQVMPDSGGRVIRVTALSSHTATEWRLGSGSGDQVIQATVSEIMTAVGQHQMPGLMAVGAIGPQKTK